MGISIKSVEYLKSRTVVNENGCWTWQGAKDKNGYGSVWHNSQMWKVHRLMYQLAIGLIPDNLEIDHICFNPPCINPDHMRLVNHRTNCQNKKVGSRPTCKAGHQWTEANCYRDQQGHRVCRTCRDNRVRDYYRKFPEKRTLAWKRYESVRALKKTRSTWETADNYNIHIRDEHNESKVSTL